MNPKDQIKQSLSILDVISTYIKVERAGSQYKARCPFHNEKTPSFYISLERGTYHCFGCGEHGDIFSFVEKMESIPFYEALTILADRANIKLTPFNKEKKEVETDLISLLKLTNKHYRNNLEKNAEAKVYLSERGLTRETIDKFEIGYSVGGSEGFRDLFIYLSKEGFSIEVMLKSGMIIKKEGEEKYFDRFRGRIMFPIKNSFGNIVGYSARILPKYDDGKVGKYINSPETEIYHKSKILFGYEQAKKSIHKLKEVILVEGQMDMIMSNQVGIDNVVATSGTAVTEEQIQILKRFADKLLLSFDQDMAGENAMKKCALLALSIGIDVYVIPKKEGVKDTADLIRDYGSKKWEELIGNRKPLIEYLTEKIFLEIKDNRERNIQVRKEVLPYLRVFSSDMERSYFINYLANKLNIPENDILNDLKRIKIEDNFESEKYDEIKFNNNENKLIRIIKNILAILKWKNIQIHEYIHDYLDMKGEVNKEGLDFEKEFIELSKEIPEEIIEIEIIKNEKEISRNLNYIDLPNKFIKHLLLDLTKALKIEIIEKEIQILSRLPTKSEEDYRRINELQQIKYKFR